MLSGGTLKTDTHSLIEPIADNTIKNLNVDKAFIGITYRYRFRKRNYCSKSDRSKN